MDGDNGIFSLSFAVIDQENETNWNLLMPNIKEATVHLSVDYVVVSDRQNGLLAAATSFSEHNT